MLIKINFTLVWDNLLAFFIFPVFFSSIVQTAQMAGADFVFAASLALFLHKYIEVKIYQQHLSHYFLHKYIEDKLEEQQLNNYFLAK